MAQQEILHKLNVQVKVTISFWDAFKLRLAGLKGTLDTLRSGEIEEMHNEVIIIERKNRSIKYPSPKDSSKRPVGADIEQPMVQK